MNITNSEDRIQPEKLFSELQHLLRLLEPLSSKSKELRLVFIELKNHNPLTLERTLILEEAFQALFQVLLDEAYHLVEVLIQHNKEEKD